MVIAKKRFIKIISLLWGLSPLWLLVWNGVERLYGGDGFAAAFLTILTIPIFGLFGTIIGFSVCKQNGDCSQTLSAIFSKLSVLILWTLVIGWLFFHCAYKQIKNNTAQLSCTEKTRHVLLQCLL